MEDKQVKFEIHRDDGQIFIIDDSVWRIPENGLSGWHTLSVDVATLDNVTRDGGVITNQRIGMVDRTIIAEMRKSSANAGARRYAERFFIPKRRYTVYATYMGRTRKCEGVQSGFALTEYNVYDPVQLTWTILCPDPYMKGIETDKSSTKLPALAGAGMPYLVSGAYADLGRTKVASGFVTGIGQDYSINAGVNASNVRFCENTGDIPAIPTFELNKKANYPSSPLNIEIIMLETRQGTDGNPMFVMGDRKLTLKGVVVSTGGMAPLFISFPLIIDLSSRPFRLYDSAGKRVEFQELSDDSLMRDPYIEPGIWAYEFKVTKTPTPSIADNNAVVNAEILPTFTGV